MELKLVECSDTAWRDYCALRHAHGMAQVDRPSAGVFFAGNFGDGWVLLSGALITFGMSFDRPVMELSGFVANPDAPMRERYRVAHATARMASEMATLSRALLFARVGSRGQANMLRRLAFVPAGPVFPLGMMVRTPGVTLAAVRMRAGAPLRAVQKQSPPGDEPGRAGQGSITQMSQRATTVRGSARRRKP